jgi:hypothetical protein
MVKVRSTARARLGLSVVASVAGLIIVWFIRQEVFWPKSTPSAAALAAAGAPSKVSARGSLAAELTSAAVAASPACGDSLSILLNASREELTTSARTMLARGRPVEEVITLLDYLAATRPEFSLDLARDIGRSDDERQILLLAVLDDWAHADPAAALQWAQNKSDQYNLPGAASLLYVVLEQVAVDDPRAAVTFADTVLTQRTDAAAGPNGAAVPRLTVEALIQSGHVDLARQVIEKWSESPRGTDLDSAVYEVSAMSLSQTSPSAAVGWLLSLPVTPSRNQALLTIETVWAQTDAATAIGWAQGLSPVDGHDDAVVSIFARWLSRDPVAAKGWLTEPDVLRESDRLISRLLAVQRFAASTP